MLDTHFSFVKTDRNQNWLTDETLGEGFQGQLSLWLPCWAVCFENRRTFGEAAANSIFLPAGFIDKWDFRVSASHLSITMESADESACFSTWRHPWPLVRTEARGISHRRTGRRGGSVSPQAFPSTTGLGVEALSHMVKMQVMESRFWCLCFPLLPTLRGEDQAKIKTDLTHHLLTYCYSPLPAREHFPDSLTSLWGILLAYHGLVLALLCGMWDLSSLTRDQSHTPCIGSRVLITGLPRKSYKALSCYTFLCP